MSTGQTGTFRLQYTVPVRGTALRILLLLLGAYGCGSTPVVRPGGDSGPTVRGTCASDGEPTGTGPARTSAPPKLAGYIDQIRETVNRNWHPRQALKSLNARGVTFEPGELSLELRVILHSDGQVACLRVLRSSGIEELDRAGIWAFESVSDFPNPPVGIADADGEIRFNFTFAVILDRKDGSG